VSGEDKRFDPTPSRRARAVREGNVVRSSELGTVAAFGAALCATVLVLPPAARSAASALAAAADGSAANGPALRALPFVLVLAGGALVPALSAAAASMAAALAQGGGLHVAAPHLDLQRLNPVSGLKRMAGAEAVIGAARATLALAVTLTAVAPALRDLAGGATVAGNVQSVAPIVERVTMHAWLAAFAVGAAFAIADYALARRRWLRGLRMSFDELRREAKENEGDPQARARRKTAHRAVLRGAVGRTREASFVVVNPEHVAVALRYAPPEVPVPMILVRALDDAALRVKALAREHAIPVVEDAALARLLYASGENDRPIPPDAYVAVALIVAALVREGALACDPG
jgi:type III secretion protein U